MNNIQPSNDDEGRDRSKRNQTDKEKDTKRLVWSLTVMWLTIEEIENGLRKLKEKVHAPFE